MDLVQPFEAATRPDGLHIRAVEPDEDLAAVHAILDEAFADDWGYHPEPFDRWAEEHRASPSFDPTLWLLARSDD